MIDLSKMTTESRNPKTMDLDQMSGVEIATTMNQEDFSVVVGVQREVLKIGHVIEMVASAFRLGGRLIYMGAGTSGRLGLLDAVECPPTFGVDFNQVIGLIAGGEKAFIKAVEGAEDSEVLAVEDLKGIELTANDIVIGIAASGRTPYVIGGLNYARSLGCKTCSISNNSDCSISKGTDVAIELNVGPEVLTGSTRLKSGTSQKMVLNMISTGAMVLTGKAYQNLMVDVQQTNLKLEARARNIVMTATGVSEEVASVTLVEANGHVKLAIVMLLLGCDAKTGIKQLEMAQGHVKKAIKGEAK